MKNQLTNAEIMGRLSQIQPEDYETLLPWYKSVAKSIQEIHCGESDNKLDTLIAIEVEMNEMNGQPMINPHHHEGKFVVAVGNRLLSYRPRLDGAMGYQAFGMGTDDQPEIVDSLWSQLENNIVPKREKFTAVSEKSKQKIKDKIEHDNYKPPMKKTKLGHKMGGFELRKVT